MRRRAAFILTAVLLMAFSRSPGRSSAGKISADLLKAMADAAGAASPLRVWAYFTDKGVADGAPFASALAEARRGLGEHTRWRRAKVRTEGNLTDLEDLPVRADYEAEVRARALAVRTVSRWLNAASVETTPDGVWGLAALDGVERLDLVRAFRRNEDPGTDGEDRRRAPAGTDAPSTSVGALAAGTRDPVYGGAYPQLAQINVPALHKLGYSGRGVTVAILDVGFHWSHEVFRLSRLVAQRDFVFKDGDVMRNAADPADYSDAHGTATWSLLGGFKFGTMVGPAFGADILLAKTEVGSSETPIEEDYWVAGIEWAESLGAEVVSSSLGYTDWYTFAQMDGKTAVTTKAANRAVGLGVVVVNAAGNERRNPWAHIIAPADGYGVIAVGAVDAAGKIAPFSSPGPTADGRIKPEVCAWGVSNLVAAVAANGTDTYVTGSGTSYATPLVAGVVALLLEAHPEWTPAQVRNALMGTAGGASAPNNDYGWGIVNALAASAYR